MSIQIGLLSAFFSTPVGAIAGLERAFVAKEGLHEHLA